MEVDEILLSEIKILTIKVDNIIERLVRLEERTSRKATMYGLFGGTVATLPVLIWWVVKTF